MSTSYYSPTELDPVSLTLEELAGMDPLALHQLAKKSAGSRTRYGALSGRLLLAIQSTGTYLEHGCSSAVHYAMMQLGMSARGARLFIRVARALESLPYLRRLANNGDIEWSKLREVVRVATPETEREWAQLCQEHTYAEIEKLVSLTCIGDSPGSSVPTPSRLRFTFEPKQMAVLKRGLQVLCEQMGRAVSMAEAVELLFAEKLAKGPVDEARLEQVREEAMKDLGWTASDEEIKIVNSSSRVPSKSQRRKILRRDGYCCSVPGCPNTLWLEVHHILFYGEGGSTRPDNLITICSKCHQNVHEGRLVIRGNAPHGVQFLNQFGKDIREQRVLEVAYWLDIWCGWRDSEENRRYVRAASALRAAELARKKPAA